MGASSAPDASLLPEVVILEELERALRTARVQTVVQAMREAGCAVDRSFFKVLDCHLLEAGGGYSPAHGVLLCRNQLRTVEQVHSTVLHELLHAYDDCRAQPQGGLDWTNCHQHACAEVRAASLSGDCDWAQEAWRGNVSAAAPSTWLGYHRRCVQRRATLSVALNPRCSQEPGCAAAAVQHVFERCMQDVTPFAQQGATTRALAGGSGEPQQQQQQQQQQQNGVPAQSAGAAG